MPWKNEIHSPNPWLRITEDLSGVISALGYLALAFLAIMGAAMAIVLVVTAVTVYFVVKLAVGACTCGYGAVRSVWRN